MCADNYFLKADNERLRAANEYLSGLIGRVNKHNVQLQKELDAMRGQRSGWYQDCQNKQESQNV